VDVSANPVDRLRWLQRGRFPRSYQESGGGAVLDPDAGAAGAAVGTTTRIGAIADGWTTEETGAGPVAGAFAAVAAGAAAGGATLFAANSGFEFMMLR
jgi:hypothetical protein